jgi:hypothetical protein
MPDQPDARLALSPTQQELFKALADKRSDMALCYHGGIATLNDEALPDRLPLAAHAFRELMEKLPGDGTAIDTGAALADEVRALRQPWDNAVAEDAAHGGQTWTNGIEESLRAFLVTVTAFFKGRDAVAAGRRQQTVEFLNRLDVAAVRLPEDVQRRNANQWMQLRGYFNNVAHHRFPAAEAEFLDRVTQLEAFLYARLIPRPTADFAAIDALLLED